MDQTRLKELLTYDAATGLFTWNSTGKTAGWSDKKYRRIRLDGKLYLQHRLVWLYLHGAFPKDQLDHINRDGMDNRPANLRECNNQQNQTNRGSRKGSSSKYVGVYYHKTSGRWRAKLKRHGVYVVCRLFDTEEQARDAYHKAKGS